MKMHFIPLVLTLFVGCAATPDRIDNAFAQSAEAEALRSHWYIASEDPFAFYPKGLSAEAPTTPAHGHWVHAGDTGICFFIPKNGVKGSSAATLHELADEGSVALQVTAADWPSNRMAGLAKNVAAYTGLTTLGLSAELARIQNRARHENRIPHEH